MALTDKLSAIGNAIREKGGTTELLTLTEMPEAIANLPSGGVEIPEITLTGAHGMTFNSSGKLDILLPVLEGKITTKDLTGIQEMFANSLIDKIPFDINLSNDTSAYHTQNCYRAFYTCGNLTEFPKIKGKIRGNCGEMFSNCVNVRNIPDSWITDMDWSFYHEFTQGIYGRIGGLFKGCYSLRKIPEALLKNIYSACTSNQDQLFYYCYTLDEIVGLRGPNSVLTSNQFSNTFNDLHRINRLVFDMDNGNPRVQNWKSQTIDLSNYIGYSRNVSSITYYNSGITEDKEVKDDATYQALKNDADWFTLNVDYSRYNHDSAVETINSLPDCSSSGGTNTIKFRGAAGSKTDGGAINTLTEEEIAVATAKGWTVSLV